MSLYYLQTNLFNSWKTVSFRVAPNIHNIFIFIVNLYFISFEKLKYLNYLIQGKLDTLGFLKPNTERIGQWSLE